MREFEFKGEEQIMEFAEEVAQSLEKGDVLALIGELGVGKTTLTKYIAKYLGVKETVKSPTFNIVSEYLSGALPLYHFDVYRMKNYDDVFESGIEDYFEKDGVCIIEWADMIGDILPDKTKCIFMEYGLREGERIYKCTF